MSGLISNQGAPRALLLLWLQGAFELIACPALLSELRRVLLRENFRPYVTPREVRAYLELLHRLSSIQADPPVTSGVTPDPGDDYLVALARSAAAEFLVSGDHHLTSSRSFAHRY